MDEKKTITFAIMDPPYESARSTTALRLIAACLQHGHNVNVFAYEGAVALSFAQQKQHPNPVHGRDVEQEDHPLTHRWVAALLRLATSRRAKLDWVNCGMCVDERGVGDSVEGVRRGSPADFWKMVADSDNTLAIPVK